MVLALLPIFGAAPASAEDPLVPPHQVPVSRRLFLVVDVGGYLDVQRVAIWTWEINPGCRVVLQLLIDSLLQLVEGGTIQNRHQAQRRALAQLLKPETHFLASCDGACWTDWYVLPCPELELVHSPARGPVLDSAPKESE